MKHKQFGKDNKGNFKVSKFEFQIGWFFFIFFEFFLHLYFCKNLLTFGCWVTGALINIFFFLGNGHFQLKQAQMTQYLYYNIKTNWIFSIYFLISTQDLDNDIVHREVHFNPFLLKYDTNAQKHAKTYKLWDGMPARISSRNNKSKEQTRSNLPYLPSLMLSSRLCANRSKCNSATNWEKLQIFPWV